MLHRLHHVRQAERTSGTKGQRVGQIVGIDLGTTFSAIAYVGALGKPEIIENREGQRITPSVVLFQGDQVVVGAMAKRSAPTAPDDVVEFVKRQMGDPSWRFTTSSGTDYTAEQVSAFILKRLKEDAEEALGEPVTDAVITVPAYFDDSRRKATMDAGTIAGLNVRRVLNEPTAAALSYGLDTNASGTALVYDLGGGTFDVTIMRLGGGEFEVIATLGDRNLGGFDWDNEIMNYVNDQVQAQGGPDLFDDDLRTAELRDRAEAAKQTLTKSTEVKVFIAADGRNFTVPLTRSTFEELTEGLLGRTESLTITALEDAGFEWGSIDQLLLVGGSTRMPMVQEMMKKLSGRTPEKSTHPDLSVALGAAIQAHIISDEHTPGTALVPLAGTDGKRIQIQDVTALGLGALALDEGEKMSNFVVVPHNAKIPAKGRQSFATIIDQQSEVNVQITEGDDPDPSYVKVVGESMFKLPPYPKGSPIDVAIAFDIDGIVHAEVFDGVTGRKLGDMEIDRKSNLDSAQVEQMRDEMRKREID